MTIYPTQQEIRDAVRSRDVDGFADLNSQVAARRDRISSVKAIMKEGRARDAADIAAIVEALAEHFGVPVERFKRATHVVGLVGQLAHEARRIAHAAQR